MAEHQLTLLVPESASKARAELLSALQIADNPSAWMDFMETVTRLLPDILSPGRPSTDSINRSAIGQLGFKSWQAMIEAPAELGGLAWNFSAWKAWRRAWATVQANPWLRSQPLTSSEINTLANDLKRLGRPFPGSLEALLQMQQEKLATAEQKRSDTLSEAQKALGVMTGKVDALTEQLRLEREQNAQISSEAGRLRGEVEKLRTELETLSKPQASPRSLSRWEHLKAAVLGS